MELSVDVSADLLTEHQQYPIIPMQHSLPLLVQSLSLHCPPQSVVPAPCGIFLELVLQVSGDKLEAVQWLCPGHSSLESDSSTAPKPTTSLEGPVVTFEQLVFTSSETLWLLKGIGAKGGGNREIGCGITSLTRRTFERLSGSLNRLKQVRKTV